MRSKSIIEGAWIAVVKKGMKEHVSVGGEVGLGRGTLMEKSPVGTSTDVGASAAVVAFFAARFCFC